MIRLISPIRFDASQPKRMETTTAITIMMIIIVESTSIMPPPRRLGENRILRSDRQDPHDTNEDQHQ